MIKVSDLRGYKSLKALNAFHALMLGLKMLPAYCAEQYEEFFARVSDMPAADQEKLIREAAIFVQLQPDEVEALIGFCKDPNGVSYRAENINSLGPKEFVDCIVAVCMEIAKIKVNLVSETEKKN
jgi:hypothetical protein